jgi:hypothetical protein
MLKITYEHRIELIRELSASVRHLHDNKAIFGLPGTHDENPIDTQRAVEQFCGLPISIQYPAKALMGDLVNLLEYRAPVLTYPEVLELVEAATAYVQAADMINAIALKNVAKAPRVSAAHIRHVKRNEPHQLRAHAKRFLARKIGAQ